VWHARQIVNQHQAQRSPGGVRDRASRITKAIDEKKLDVIIDKLDHRLADSLAKANAAEMTRRKAELKNQNYLAEYINYVKSNP
jgi:hypothetical protein